MLEEFLPLVGLNDWTNLDTSFLTFKGFASHVYSNISCKKSCLRQYGFKDFVLLLL